MSRRSYHMVARAAAAEQTTTRVYTAAAELFAERPFADVTVQTVADRAGVTLQTVLRKFGSKEALFKAAGPRIAASIREAREPAVPRDTRTAVVTLCRSYEA